MKPFCEVVVADVLPAIRALITRELLTNYNLTQKEVADLLGLTQPAVSQYLRESRGRKVKIFQDNEKIMKLIEKLSKDIVTKKPEGKEIQRRFCEICKEIRKAGLICKLHEKIYPKIYPCDECLT